MKKDSTSTYQAKLPHRLPLKAWFAVAMNTFKKIQKDNLNLVAAGVAFYFLLAIFPMLFAFVSIYGFFSSPGDIAGHVEQLIGLLPEASREIILEQITEITSKSDKTLTISAVLSFLLALWGGSKGAKALVIALNISYSEGTKRSFIKLIFINLVITTATIGLLISALAIISILPIALDSLGFQHDTDIAVKLISWPLLALLFNFGLASLYRYGPHRRSPKWRWVTPGSILASVLWIGASYGFSYYVSHFARYNETYGSLGSVIVLMLWLLLTAYIIILGAEVNAAIEHHNTQDTTEGEPKEMGKRGAHVADTLPKD
ncbi:YihY/virulence factor BrkB family protein [Flocculibacter collagenilyticus]|uniref:YihY/virulence factor BrkB family protein n=1 Tax=Flocculibacter collagenilyticus TaxID=2744479 RepID=UPI001F411873|nr:YihY/virulence factor BrkB family protein [Flocculibacter collagenilyticus]